MRSCSPAQVISSAQTPLKTQPPKKCYSSYCVFLPFSKLLISTCTILNCSYYRKSNNIWKGFSLVSWTPIKKRVQGPVGHPNTVVFFRVAQGWAKVAVQFVWEIIQYLIKNTRINSVSCIYTCKPTFAHRCILNGSGERTGPFCEITILSRQPLNSHFFHRILNVNGNGWSAVALEVCFPEQQHQQELQEGCLWLIPGRLLNQKLGGGAQHCSHTPSSHFCCMLTLRTTPSQSWLRGRTHLPTPRAPESVIVYRITADLHRCYRSD